MSVWAALEVSVEDVFASFCIALPPTDARLTKVRVSVAEFSALDEAERYRHVWHRADSPERPAVDRWDDLLGLLGVNADVADAYADGEAPVAAVTGTVFDNSVTRLTDELSTLIEEAEQSAEA